MPHNENGNPYQVDHPLHEVYESAGPAQRSALRGDPLPPASADRQDFTVPAVGNAAHTLTAVTEVHDPYAPSTWGQPAERDFTCPSGQVCRVRRVDVMDLLSGGLLNNVDFLTAVVRDQHIPNANSPAGADPEAAVDAIKKMSSAGADMAGFRETIHSVVMRVVVRPALHPAPAPGDDRKNGVVYIDSVPMTDQTSIFNWAITGQDEESLKQFRRKAGESVGDVEHGEVVQHEAVDVLGDKASG